MSANMIATASPRSAPLMLLVRIGEGVKALRQAWKVASRDAASRRNLSILDDRMLSDIGVSQAQARFEAARWR
jgi:uncharacterized protein YjiS (DUF1127 family)